MRILSRLRRRSFWAVLQGSRLLPLALATVRCGEGDVQPTRSVTMAIIGGEATRAGDYSSVAWLSSGCSAVLVHPEVLLTAGHCAGQNSMAWFGDELLLRINDEQHTVEVTDPLAARAVDVSWCQSYDDSAPATGMDIAICMLREPVPGVTPVLPMDTCERASVVIDDSPIPVELVGFGFTDEANTQAGRKAVAPSSAVWIEPEFEIGNHQSGSCKGDSGGPAFVEVRGSETRVLGVLSSGQQGICGKGWYTDVSSFLDWLESASGKELRGGGDGTCSALAIDAGSGAADSFAERMGSQGGCALATNGQRRASLGILALAGMLVLAMLVRGLPSSARIE
jgi:hypothetical protein